MIVYFMKIYIQLDLFSANHLAARINSVAANDFFSGAGCS
jgi:hypothetical protein